MFFDMTVKPDLAALHRLLKHPQLSFVHMSPPDGTCSRARERARRGVPGGGPPPLRSDDFPLGFPDLSERLPSHVARVEAENDVCQACTTIAEDLLSRSVAFASGAPRDSLLWKIPHMKALISKPTVSRVDFQHCMYGGSHSQWTSFHFAPAGLFDGLAIECDGSHKHESRSRLPDGTFSSALVTVYPQDLCDAMRNHLLSALNLSELQPLPVQRARGSPLAAPPRDDRAASGLQPRGVRARRLLPEFKEVILGAW